VAGSGKQKGRKLRPMVWARGSNRLWRGETKTGVRRGIMSQRGLEERDNASYEWRGANRIAGTLE